MCSTEGRKLLQKIYTWIRPALPPGDPDVWLCPLLLGCRHLGPKHQPHRGCPAGLPHPADRLTDALPEAGAPAQAAQDWHDPPEVRGCTGSRFLIAVYVPAAWEEARRNGVWGWESFRSHLINSFFDPFLPTGQFLAPKLIILIKCLIDIFILQSVVLMFLYVEQDMNLAWQSCSGLKYLGIWIINILAV